MISADELYKVVCELEANTNPAPDGIPAYFVKECWASLQSPTLHILNESFRQGSFPSMWKHAFVVPIFKAGDRQELQIIGRSRFCLPYPKSWTALCPVE